MAGHPPGVSPPTSQDIELRGDCDARRKDELRSLFDSLSAHLPVRINLTAVTFMDSTALSLLVLLRRRLEDTQITLIGPNSNIRKLLELTRFEDQFAIVDAPGS